MSDWQNLSDRQNDDYRISLDFRKDTLTEDSEVRVSVHVISSGEDFTLYPPNNLALDCFNHPFAYAHRAIMSGRMDKVIS